MILSRWTTIETFSAGMWYRCMASMTSSPLFIRLAESTVILAPMDQLGLCKASSLVTRCNSSVVLPKKGPPEQVRIRRFTSPRSRLPCSDWNRAECSESTGRISAPKSWASSITSSPPHTKVSLLARAMRLPSRMAAMVGRRPTIPTTAVSTVSALGRAAASIRPSIPASTFTEVSARRTFKSAAAFSSMSTASSGP